MLSGIYYHHPLLAAHVVVDIPGPRRQADIIVSALEQQYRYLDASGIQSAVTHVDVEAEPLGSELSYAVDERLGLHGRLLVRNSLEKSRERFRGRVCDYAADIWTEPLLLGCEKCRGRTGTPADHIYPAVRADPAPCKLEPRLEVDALLESVCVVPAAADAVRSLVHDQAVALDLFHEELGICRHLRRVFVIAVDEYRDVPARPVRRRPEVRRQRGIIESLHPDAQPLCPVCIEPVLAASEDRGSVYLHGRPVHLRDRSGSVEYPLEEPVAEGNINSKEGAACQKEHDDSQYGYEERCAYGQISRQLFPPAHRCLNSGVRTRRKSRLHHPQYGIRYPIRGCRFRVRPRGSCLQ